MTLPAAPVRVDAWIEAGRVSPHYDPMLAKVITSGDDRDAALDALAAALAGTRVDGVTTNLGLLRAVVRQPDVRAVTHSTSTLDGLGDPEPRIDVLEPGGYDRPGLAGAAGLLAGRRAAERPMDDRRRARPTSPSAIPRARPPWRSPRPGRPCDSPMTR